MKKHWIVFFLGICFSFQAKAQLDNQRLTKPLSLQTADSGSLFLQIENLNFVKNNEYFNDIVRGRTYLGYQFLPTLVYFPSENLRVELGGFFWKDFGNENFSQIAPFFSVKYQKNKFALTIGNLEGDLNHQLIEPLYEFENIINQRLENGLQLQWKGTNFYTDIWVDWQKMIYPASDFQEEIFAGLHTYYNFVATKNFTLRLPLQFTILHKGGQINQGNIPVTNTINQAVGLYADIAFESGFFKGIRTENYWVNFTGEQLDSLSMTGTQSLQGGGVYANLMFRFKYFDILGSYWQAEKFNSAQGGAVYRSYDNREGALVEAERQLLFLRILSTFPLGAEADILFRVEPYWDIQKNIWEFSSGLYLVWKPRFRLAQNLQLKTKNEYKEK